MAASDVVLTKPGYGIASECVLNRTPLVSIERRGFREEGELLRLLDELGPLSRMSLGEFFAGEWNSALSEVLDTEPRWAELPLDGAQQVARRLLQLFHLL